MSSTCSANFLHGRFDSGRSIQLATDAPDRSPPMDPILRWFPDLWVGERLNLETEMGALFYRPTR